MEYFGVTFWPQSSLRSKDMVPQSSQTENFDTLFRGLDSTKISLETFALGARSFLSRILSKILQISSSPKAHEDFRIVADTFSDRNLQSDLARTFDFEAGHFSLPINWLWFEGFVRSFKMSFFIDQSWTSLIRLLFQGKCNDVWEGEGRFYILYKAHPSIRNPYVRARKQECNRVEPDGERRGWKRPHIYRNPSPHVVRRRLARTWIFA